MSDGITAKVEGTSPVAAAQVLEHDRCEEIELVGVFRENLQGGRDSCKRDLINPGQMLGDIIELGAARLDVP